MSLPSWSLGKVLTWPLLTLAFTPLIVTSATIYPYVFGKTVFIRFCVTIFWFLLVMYLFRSNRDEIKERLDFTFLKKPTFILVLLFTISALVSTLFAVNPYRAFFGDIERGEGLLTSLFLFLFLVGALMLFKRKDWLDFFKLSLLVGGLIALDVTTNFIQTGMRAGGSFVGNPIFVAGYLLFVIFAAFMVASGAKDRFWRALAPAVAVLSMVGIGVTESRGVLVGVFVALVSLVAYLLVQGRSIHFKFLGKSWNVRRVSAVSLVAISLLLLIFLVTKSNSFWQKVPGLDRLAQVSANDISTQTRLIAIGVSLDAVNPTISGMSKFLVGWGPENYDMAYNENYNPRFFKFEAEWFDRAHNRVLDVVVMQGMIGLLIFLTLWIKVLWNGFVVKSREHNQEGHPEMGKHLISMGIIFFAVAYFVQNLFVFDQITTLVPVFAFLGFIIHARERGGETTLLDRDDFFIGFRAATLFVTGLLLMTFTLYSVTPFYQTSNFITGIQASASGISERIDRMTWPYNYAQAEIRYRLLVMSPGMLGTPEGIPVAVQSEALMREVVAREPFDPRALQSLGVLNSVLGKMANDPALLAQGEEDYRQALELAPRRQEIMFSLAVNLVSQGKIDEAVSLAKEIVALEPEAAYGQYYYGAIVAPYDWDGDLGGLSTLEKIFGENKFIFSGASLGQHEIALIREIYDSYLYHFYQEKDGDSLSKTMRQAVLIENLMEKAQKRFLEEGVIREVIPSRASVMEAGLRAFLEKGWAPAQTL